MVCCARQAGSPACCAFEPCQGLPCLGAAVLSPALRRKIEADPKAPQIIATVRGGGYMFTPAVQRA